MIIFHIILFLFLLCMIIHAKHTADTVQSIDKNKFSRLILGENAASLFPYPDELYVQSYYSSPEIVRIYNFLTIEECNELISHSVPLVEPSYASSRGQRVYSAGRNSSTHFYNRYNSSIDRLNFPLAEKLEQRFSALIDLSIDHQVGFNFLRYNEKERFQPHYDSREDSRLLIPDGMRYYSMLVYLNELPIYYDAPDRGGNTVFVHLNRSFSPIQGSALLWRNIDNEGRMDYRLLHQGDYPKTGVKYLLNMFSKEGNYYGLCKCNICLQFLNINIPTEEDQRIEFMRLRALYILHNTKPSALLQLRKKGLPQSIDESLAVAP
jgi:hypothetical protein